MLCKSLQQFSRLYGKSSIISLSYIPTSSPEGACDPEAINHELMDLLVEQ
jgi:hypothetical protein